MTSTTETTMADVQRLIKCAQEGDLAALAELVKIAERNGDEDLKDQIQAIGMHQAADLQLAMQKAIREYNKWAKLAGLPEKVVLDNPVSALRRAFEPQSIPEPSPNVEILPWTPPPYPVHPRELKAGDDTHGPWGVEPNRFEVTWEVPSVPLATHHY